jgi:hypothetical protein
MLRASGQTIEGPRPCDSFDVFVDEQGDLVVLLMDIPIGPEASDEFAHSLLHKTRLALKSHTPLHAVVNALELELSIHPGIEVGLAMLRLSQRDARVEVLNAGMPAIANAAPGEYVNLHPALSGPVGRRVGEVHPYELVPLRWGSTWLCVSDGMTNGSLDAETTAALCAKLDLGEHGLSLTTASGDEQYDAFQSLLASTRFVRDDASFVLVSADPDARFQSGFID